MKKNKGVTLSTNEVFPDLKDNQTSLDRYMHIMDSMAKKTNKLYNFFKLFKVNDSFEITLSPLYKKNNENFCSTSIFYNSCTPPLIANPVFKPYEDGGIEYLCELEPRQIDKKRAIFYKCNLFMPSSNSVLSYSHLSKNDDLIKRTKQLWPNHEM